MPKVLIEIDPEQARLWDTQAMGHVVAYAIKMAVLGEPYSHERGVGEVFFASGKGVEGKRPG